MSSSAPIKLHKNLVNSVAETLKEIFVNKRYADRAIEKLFKQNLKWGSRDRRFVAEAVYDIVRNFRLYSELAQSEKNFWFITGVWLVIKEIQIPDWPEFKHLDSDFIFKLREKLKSNTVINESYPDWLWEMGTAELGKEAWEREAIEMNKQAQVILRVNTLKTDSQKFEAAFKTDGIELRKNYLVDNCYELAKRENVFKNNYFKEGWFEVQDVGSQMISEFADPKNGQTVIDACAGAGGKSLHLAALMQNKGKIYSMDVEAFKLEELKKRSKRAGAFNIETRLIENDDSIKKLESKADLLLLDVPCSGVGVIKRNPDAKWKLSVEMMEKVNALQKKILNQYHIMVKPGGNMVYSTCSIFPSENKKQVEEFLKSHSDFKFVRDKSVLPSEGYDGFYMALLNKSL